MNLTMEYTIDIDPNRSRNISNFYQRIMNSRFGFLFVWCIIGSLLIVETVTDSITLAVGIDTIGSTCDLANGMNMSTYLLIYGISASLFLNLICIMVCVLIWKEKRWIFYIIFGLVVASIIFNIIWLCIGIGSYKTIILNDCDFKQIVPFKIFFITRVFYISIFSAFGCFFKLF